MTCGAAPISPQRLIASLVVVRQCVHLFQVSTCHEVKCLLHIVPSKVRHFPYYRCNMPALGRQGTITIYGSDPLHFPILSQVYIYVLQCLSSPYYSMPVQAGIFGYRYTLIALFKLIQLYTVHVLQCKRLHLRLCASIIIHI